MARPEMATPGGNRANAEDTKADTEIVCQAGDERKIFATTAAVAAQAGCALYELAGGGYLLTRWGMSRELPDLAAVRDLLRRMGGAA